MATAPALSDKFDIGRVLSRTMEIFARNWAVFLLFGLLAVGVPQILSGLMVANAIGTVNPLDPGAAFAMFASPLYWLSLLISVAATYFLQAGIVHASLMDFNNRKPSFNDALQAGLRYMLPLLGLAILSFLGIYVGMILLIVPGIILAIMWSVTVPILIEEKTGVMGSFGRSRALTKGSRWSIFGLFVVLLIAYLVVALVIGGLATIAIRPILEGGLGMFSLGAQIGGALIGAVIGPLFGVLVASLYIELRTVKEGAGPQDLIEIFS
jgi:hypothetical protein